MDKSRCDKCRSAFLGDNMRREWDNLPPARQEFIAETCIDSESGDVAVLQLYWAVGDAAGLEMMTEKWAESVGIDPDGIGVV